jgi:hypothetical protein
MSHLRLLRFPALLIVAAFLVQHLTSLPNGRIKTLVGELPALGMAWGGWRVVRSGRGGLGAAAGAGILLSGIVWVLMTVGWLLSSDAPPSSVVALVVAKASLMFLPVAAAMGVVGGLIARLIGSNVPAQPALAADGAARRR